MNDNRLHELKNYAKQVLMADGPVDLCVDRRVDNYDTLDKTKIIDSRDIHGGLVDTYGQFDLTELSFMLDEGEQNHFADIGCDFGGKSFECEVDCKGVGEFMAWVAADYFENEIAGLKLKVARVYSPRFYNYETDSCEWLVEVNPFDSIEKLTAEMKRVAVDNNDYIEEYYIAIMCEQLDNYLFEHITGYTIDNKTYTYNEMVKKFGGEE